MSAFLASIIAVIIVSLISLIGVLVLIIKNRLLEKILLALVAFSAGGLLGGAFFHLIPESLKLEMSTIGVFVWVVIGFSLFFILEGGVRWHHCHQKDCHERSHLGWMNLIGDAAHNLIDGMVIFAAFSVDVSLGIPVTIAIILHEIPQELGDFGVLVYSGFSKLKALAFNFVSALVALLGVVLAYVFLGLNNSMEQYLLPFAAGGFIYIAASDLIPEIHKENKVYKSFISFLFFIVAIVIMLLIRE